MSYLVLARKWRPQTFDDVAGQEHVVRTLANAIEQGRVAHAFLLCGPRGVGKTTTARLLARALNCAKGPTANPCGECLPCKEITQGVSVDVAEIDGASNNGVDNVRELREAARYMPQRDRHKIFVIDEVHMLSVAAFNALLKTLEEPPPHVKFIFATTDPQKLPDTILSRCQRHNFRRIPLPKMADRLERICREEAVEISRRSLELVARQADGGMRDALSLLDQLLSSVGTTISDEAVAEALGLVDRTTVLGLLEGLLARDGKALLARVAEVHERGVDLKKLCEELAQALRDLVYVKVTGAPPEGRADAEEQELVALAAKADVAQLTRLFDVVHGTIRDLGHSAQPRLALEVALLNAIHLAPAQGLADLAARLERISAGLGPAQATAHAAPAPALFAPSVRSGAAGAPSASPVSSKAAADARRPAPAPAPGAERSRRQPPAASDLVSRVESAVKARGAGREASSRPGKPSPGPSDDEPPPPSDDDAPPADDDGAGAGAARARPLPLPLSPPLPREAAPGGGATFERFEACPTIGPRDAGDRLPDRASRGEDAPLVGFALRASLPEPGGDDPTVTPGERWNRAVDLVRRLSPRLGAHVAEGRLVWLRPGEVALGFTPDQAFHRKQLGIPEAIAEVETALAGFFGARTSLRLADAAADAPVSVAEAERRARDERAKRIRAEARESEAVRAVQTVLGGEIEDIEVLEER